MLITEKYRKLNERAHASMPSYGTSGKNYKANVNYLASLCGAETILDYGCGKQTLKEALPGLNIIGYDPAIKGLDTPPKPADMVVCTDVMEHVEADCIETVLAHIFSLARRGIFFVISCTEGDRKLANGELAHCSVHNPHWWRAAIQVHAPKHCKVELLWARARADVAIWVEL